MTTPQTGLPDLAGLAAALPDDVVLVQVMRPDQEQLLCTSWILAGASFTDVVAQLAAVFGSPSADLVASTAGVMGLGSALLGSEDTKISFQE
jgi:hypothetical protein